MFEMGLFSLELLVIRVENRICQHGAKTRIHKYSRGCCLSSQRSYYFPSFTLLYQ